MFLSESCSWAGVKSEALGRPQFYLQEPSISQLKSKVPTPPRRRLRFAICHVRALEPEHTRLRVGKILAPPAQEQTRFGDAAGRRKPEGPARGQWTKLGRLPLRVFSIGLCLQKKDGSVRAGAYREGRRLPGSPPPCCGAVERHRGTWASDRGLPQHEAAAVSCTE